jgi:hypothetical protein
VKRGARAASSRRRRSLAYWLTGNATTTCTLTGDGQSYVQNALANYQMLYGKAWPYPGP